jgi:hypothetical protein
MMNFATVANSDSADPRSGRWELSWRRGEREFEGLWDSPAEMAWAICIPKALFRQFGIDKPLSVLVARGSQRPRL